MKIERLKNITTRCDMSGCNNMADFKIELKRDKFLGTTDLCKSCLKDLYLLCGKYIVPQSPPNMLRKKEM